MATSIGSTGVVFPDSTTQATAVTNVPTLATYTSSGTWTKSSGLKAVKVTVVGGGGNGGPGAAPAFQSGGGGGAGGTAIKIYPAASLPGPQPYTVGGALASSAFGAAPVGTITATAGTSGGVTGNGSGGSASGGNTNISGGDGGIGLNGSYFGGIGGSSFMGGSSKAYGAGGQGASANPGAGTPIPGVQGVVIVEEYY